jgi:proton-dependent oligopeptide transporter, POT family
MITNNRESFSLVVFYLCISQMYNNLISQAGQVNLSGVPNDMIQAFSGVGCIIFGPILQAMYSLLGRQGIKFPPIARMTTGFVFCAAAMAYAAGFQHLIYSTGPCFDQPLACDAPSGGTVPNQVSVWVQLPVYALMAIGEIFTYVTAFEYAYNKSPKEIKTVVQALTQLTACVASALGMAISPVARDPYMVVFYSCLAGAMALTAVLFWWRFGKYDRIDAHLNESSYAENSIDAVSGSPSLSSDTEKKAGRPVHEEVLEVEAERTPGTLHAQGEKP